MKIKNKFLSIFLVVFMVLALAGIVQAKVYRKTGRVGNGSGDMDGEDRAILNDGDECRVFEGTNTFLWYRLDADSGVTPDDYIVIDPNDNPGSKRWILQDNSLLHYTQKNALDYGSAYTDATLQLAITDISTNHWTLLVNRGTWVIDANLTFAANTRLKFEEGAVFDIDGATVTINGDVDAGNYQIIDRDPNSTVNINNQKVIPQWFGAKGDGSTDDSEAIRNTITATPTGGTLDFPNTGLAYIVDEEFYITKKMTVTGDNYSEIKLKDSSGLFNDIGNAYGRYIFHIRADDVVFDGLEINGNSQNNYYDDPNDLRHFYTDSPVRACVGIIAGWYGPGVSYAEVNNVKIQNCWVHDTPSAGIVTYNDFTHFIYDFVVTNCLIERIHGVGVALSRARNARITNNTFRNNYMYAFQYYYDTKNSSFDNNIINLDESYIDSNYVDSALYGNDGYLEHGSAVTVGKYHTDCSRGNSVSNNTINGGWIKVKAGTEYTTISNNVITNAYHVGIQHQTDYLTIGDSTTQYDITNPSGDTYRYTWDTTGLDPEITAVNPEPGSRVYFYATTMSTENQGYQFVIASGTNYFEVNNPHGTAENDKTSEVRWMFCRGNKIINNNIYNSGGPGLYLADSFDWVDVSGNTVHGSCRLSDDYGGRTLACNIAIMSPFFRVVNNDCLTINTNPEYGIRFHQGTVARNRVFGNTVMCDLFDIHDNNIKYGGSEASFYDPCSVAHGNLNYKKFVQDSLADETGYIYFPESVSGMIFACITDPNTTFTDEAGFWQVRPDGTVSLIAGSTNAVDTDTDGKFCVIKQETSYSAIRNRMGNVGEIRAFMVYE